MTKVSVIIPTHDRPTFLREAIASVCRQTHTNWEIIVVDDGSVPPVDERDLRTEFDAAAIRVIRNEAPLKQPYARDQGVQAATGDVVVHLDDDDLFTATALETALAALKSDVSLDLVYLGARGFGERSAHFNSAQDRAVRTVLQCARGHSVMDNIVNFGSELFPALLETVPMAFQRSMEYRAVWNQVTDLRRRVYMLDPDVMDREQAMRRLQPPLRESEWAIYAAACCRTALLRDPVYLQRCDGQGYVSLPRKQESAILAGNDIKTHLLYASLHMSEFFPWRSQVRKSCARNYFDQAYYYYYRGRRRDAYRALANALRTRPNWSYLQFSLRMLLPPGSGRG